MEADGLFDHLLGALDVGAGEIDFVDDGDDLEAVRDGEVGVGECLGLDALRCIDDEQRAFAGGERARDLVGEVDVAGRVDEVELIGLAVVALYIMRTVWALMVMPRSRSRSMASSTWACISRAVSEPVSSSSRSESVDLPWSMCAMIAKLRIEVGSMRVWLISDSNRGRSID